MSTRSEEILASWYKQLKDLKFGLENFPEGALCESHLRCLGIEVSDIDIESDKAPDLGARFFSPFPQQEIKDSLCGLDPETQERLRGKSLEELVSNGIHSWDLHCLSLGQVRKFYTKRGSGKPLLGILGAHAYNLTGQREPEARTPWEDIDKGSDSFYGHLPWISSPHTPLKWEIPAAFKSPKGKKPHVQILLEADYDGECLLKCELATIVRFMLASMKLEWSRLKSKSHRQKCHTIFPILIVSVLNPRHARVIQGHFDGTLRIQRSGTYDIEDCDHQTVTTLFSRWMDVEPSGITTWITSLPSIGESSEEEA